MSECCTYNDTALFQYGKPAGIVYTCITRNEIIYIYLYFFYFLCYEFLTPSVNFARNK